MKSFLKGFKEFISKGNVIDLAVAVVIGGAFGKIVSSLVADIIMPFIGALIGTASFTDLTFTINGSIVRYGSFIQTVFDFLIISFFVYLALRLLLGAKGMIVKKSVFTKTELKAFKKQGKSKQDINILENEKVEDLKQIKEKEEAEKKSNSEEVLLQEIRDLLKENLKPASKTQTVTDKPKPKNNSKNNSKK